jgi:DNA-binding transcriptional MocR family regulator
MVPILMLIIDQWKRKSDLMRISLNRNADTPVYLQIKNQIRDMIFSGMLPESFSLPPERNLAKTLGVNRSTVIKAYQELKADGLIGSHVGKGTVVLPQVFKSSSFDDRPVNPIPWYQFFNENITSNNEHIIGDMMAMTNCADVISFAGGFPPPSLFPVKAIQEIQMELFKTASREMFLHSPVEGHYPLRESISHILKKRQIPVSPKEVVVLSGSQQGLDFAARIFIRPGETVVVEEPTFFGAIQIFRSAGARVIGAPIDKDGIRTDMLEALLIKHRPKFIYTLPTFQNPSGVTMSLERRTQLLNLAYQHQVPIIEDDPYGELRYDGISVPSLKALDRYGHVIYLSTFSKVLFLGLRVGWVVASPQVLNKFAHLKQLTDLHVNTPSQLLLDSFIRKGYYEEHVALLRREYSARRDLMLEALAKYRVPGVSWNEPEGGFYIWCRLPENVIRHKLVANAAKRGVVFLPGEVFYPDGTQGESSMRLNYTFAQPEQIQQGINSLMQAVRETAEMTAHWEQDIECYRKPIV